MEVAIVIVWSVGLVLAVTATVAVVKVALIVIQTLREILTLSGRTERAAEGLVRNLSAIPALERLQQPANRARRAAADLAAALEELDRALLSRPPRG